MTKAKSANGVRGHLLNLIDGIVVFRVYDADHNFVDYVLDHSDSRLLAVSRVSTRIDPFHAWT